MDYLDPVDPLTIRHDVAKKQAGIAALLVVAMFSIFVFAPPRDRSKPVAGIACSVLSETEISAVLGTPMQLMPASGSVCRYVSTSNGRSRALIVVAHDGLTRTYAFHVIPSSPGDSTAAAEETKLARLVHRQVANR